MKLTPIMEKYILHWGEMGSRWGVNRTVAQIHALLYLSTEPLTADEIVETLGVARSNVSTSLKELHTWGLVKIVPVLGDRRDHFASLGDIWDIFEVIIEERKRREIDPTLSMLRECVIESKDDTRTPDEIKKRIKNTLDFMEMLTTWYEQMTKVSRPVRMQVLKLGAKIQNLLGKKV